MTLETTAPNRRRSDLQGLRAFAVLVVVAYHFKLPGFPGGFVGVDIFFVLSGFFITRLLMREIETYGRVRLAAFYGARAKRLLPNSIVVLLATLVAAAVLLPTYRFNGIAEDVAFSAGFLANFHFAARAVDYFHLGDPPSPVLHYWSLAVEEQFYLVLPALMTGIALLFRQRARGLIIGLLVCIVLASWAWSIHVTELSQPQAFFHTENRAWQLALGGLVGLLFERRGALPGFVRMSAAWLGAAALLVSVAVFSDDLVYPGLWALAPTLGTALLVVGLGSGKSTAPIDRLLSFRPVSSIGDMSYSIYLWHFPVVVFASALWPDSQLAMWLALLATIVLATIAYFGIERPIHHADLQRFRPKWVLASAFASICVVLLAAGTLALLPGPTSPKIAAAIKSAVADLGENYRDGCHLNYTDIVQPPCQFGDVKGSRRVVLFGDSHAAQWFAPLKMAATTKGWVLEARTKSSCPAADVTIWYIPKRSTYDECDAWRAAQFAEFTAHPPDVVMMSSADYAGWIYDRSGHRAANSKDGASIWMEAHDRTVQALLDQGITVVEIADTPQMYDKYLTCLSAGKWSDCVRPRREATHQQVPFTHASKQHIALDFTDLLCNATECPATDGQSIIYRDAGHLTSGFAARFSSTFEQVLENLPH